MSGNLKGSLIVAIALLLIVGAFLWYYRFPKSIDVELPAVIYIDGDASSVEQTTIRIKGTLYRPLMRDERFHGRVSVGKYDYTKQFELIDIQFYRQINGGQGYITYTNFSPLQLRMFGAIWKWGNFEKAKIMVLDQQLNPDPAHLNSMFIAAPAQTYDEAQTIANSLDDAD